MKIAYNPMTAAALTAAPSNNDITFDLKGVAIYAKGVKFKGTDTTYSVFKKHTASGNTGGYNGLVPVPSYTTTAVRFLREDGTWVTPTNTTYGVVSSTANGLAPKIGTEAAATITTQADEWILTSTKGGTPTWRKLPTNAFKNDNTNTTYTLSGALSSNTYVTTLTPSSGTATTATIPAMTAATSSAAGKAGLVPAPAANKHTSFLRGDGTWVIPTNTTYSIVTASANGLVPMFDAADGTIDSQSTDWVLTNNNGSIGWYKLPANAFKNDNSNTTYTLSGVLGSNKYTVTLTPSSGNATTATIPVMTGATSSAAGKAGLVPAPGTANAGQFLRGDGTWATPSDTHWTTHLYIGAKDAASNAVTTNGNTYIKITDNSTIRNQYIIKGAGRATVASDASGNITITSPTVTWSEISGKPSSFTPSSHTHSQLQGWADTRSVANTPNDYNGAFKILGIKTAGTTLGLTSTLAGTYATIIGWRGWSDSSGGYAWEIASTDKNRLYVRSGSTTSWNNGWSAIAYTADLTWSNISGKPSTFTPRAHNHPTSQINALTSYTKATAAAALATTDSLNAALGKLEYKLDVAYDLVTKANDKDGTIENLKEILDVLAGIKDTETIKAIVGKYLPLAGGTMTGSIIFNKSGDLITGKYNNTNYSIIHDHANGNVSINANSGGLYLGYSTTSQIYCRGTNINIDSGNYTTYTVKKDGTGASGTWNISISGNSATSSKLNMTSITSYDGLTPVGVYGYTNTNSDTASNGYPLANTSAAIAWGKDNCKVILAARAGQTSSEVYIRQYYTAWGNWFKLLHSGNTYISSGTITINGASITPLTSHQSLANYVTLNTALTISGVKTFSTLLKFTVAQGTAPFTVTSNTKVTNLNSDLLDGYDSSRFLRAKDWVTSPGLDANTLELNMMCFTYSNNAPHTGTIIYFSGATGGSYGLLLNASYSSSGYLSFRSRNGDSGTWKDWSTILTLHNYTNYVNTTNFPGLNKTGTVTSVTVTGANGLSGTGTITTSGTITLSNAGVRSTTINGNYLRVNTNGTNADLTIPYATTASLLNNTSVSDPSKAASGQNVKWYSQISGSSGYAGTNYGFPVSNNANGILWLGTHSGPYGWLMGFSSNGRIYARYISNNSFSTAANGGSWNRIAWTSDIPTVPVVTNYYWANIKVSSSSSTTTTPTFAKWTTSDLNLVSYTTGGKDLGMRVTGSVNSIGFIVGSSNTNRGIYDYTNGVWIVRKDSSNNTLLESGNIGIGITSPSQKLHVGGLVNITANSGTLTIGCQNTSYTHYSTTGGTHWFNKAVEVNGNLSPHANNSFTLGTSSKRWSNVYSVLGNFSGAVTIGGKTTTVGLENNSHYSWKGGYNFYCIPTGNDQEWSFDLGAKAYGDGTNSTYTGTYLLIWSCKNSNHIARFFNDSRHVDIPIHLFVGGYNNTSYALSTSTFICNSWVRTKGATGWYNEDYGGGWYMNNADYVKVHNGKRVYTSNTSLYAFYTDGGVTAAGFYKSGSSNSYVLLGGGGHKALSDFMLKSEILTNNLTTISKSLTVTTAWMDTGIKYTDLPATGTYIVLVYVHNTADSIWYNYWSGIMSWYRDGTNDSDADEILLHRAGHAYGHTIYLRTIMTANSDGRHLRLQIAADKNLTTAATYTFKFKRII